MKLNTYNRCRNAAYIIDKLGSITDSGLRVITNKQYKQAKFLKCLENGVLN